jgi:hypothetical protein
VVVAGVVVVDGVAVVVAGVLVVVVAGVLVVAVLLAPTVFEALVVVVSEPPQAAKKSAQETESARETKILFIMGGCLSPKIFRPAIRAG